jgi:hypothetical protein
MKFLYVHLIYLSIIAFLGYNYWSSVQAFKAFEQLDVQLNMDYSVLDKYGVGIHNEIEKLSQTYKMPILTRQADIAQKILNSTDSSISFIDANKVEFLKLNGNFQTLDKDELINNFNATKTSNSFFTNAKINKIKGKLADLSKILIDSVYKQDRETISTFYNLPKLVTNDAYWQLIKSLPASASLAELSFIKNQIKMDEILFLEYYFKHNNIEELLRFDSFKTAIAPKKAVLIEGETFEADIYLAAYAPSPKKDVVIKVNGEPLEIHEGVAHFKSKNQIIGTKTIKAEAIIRNPLTGLTKTTEGSFEYQVLPKCSRDCQ